MWKLIAVYFGILSIEITNLEAINVTNDVDIFNADPLNRQNVSQISILNHARTTFSLLSQPQFNSTHSLPPYKERKIVKRNTLNIFGERINFQVELGPFGYGKIILFAILRIFCGITLDVSKVKQIFVRPIGPIIAILCHCIFLPLVSYGFGWQFFEDRAGKRLDFFESGYSIGLHTFVFEPGYVVVGQTRYVVSIHFIARPNNPP